MDSLQTSLHPGLSQGWRDPPEHGGCGGYQNAYGPKGSCDIVLELPAAHGRSGVSGVTGPGVPAVMC